MKRSNNAKQTARLLRQQGLSLIIIAKKTNIPLTTIHSWVSDIILTEAQSLALKNHSLTSLQDGRARTQAKNKARRIKEAEKLFQEGEIEMDILNKRELFIAGVGLYWAEGFKNVHERRLGFCNSDPSMIKFYVHWLKICLGVEEENLIARLTINKAYAARVKDLERYWSDVIGIPLNQFTKPFYQNSQWKKQYNTDNYNYHGVLRIHVKDSLDYLLKMRGWIEGLRQNLPG